MNTKATSTSEKNRSSTESPYKWMPPTIAVASHSASAVKTNRTTNLIRPVSPPEGPRVQFRPTCGERGTPRNRPAPARPTRARGFTPGSPRIEPEATRRAYSRGSPLRFHTCLAQKEKP
ncbi:hypothetical protein GCM10010403_48950 [Glycomyces rutgersensis]|uniref:Uncharacterized protein n=1 Tax=Glycomyces rutgersensis TaxID=58115 RepID=A0ABN3GDV8_9ACTN